jgi:hypothetical protein
MMIILVYFLPNTSGLVCAKNLCKWAEKAFVSSTLVFHALTEKSPRRGAPFPVTSCQILPKFSRTDPDEKSKLLSRG